MLLCVFFQIRNGQGWALIDSKVKSKNFRKKICIRYLSTVIYYLSNFVILHSLVLIAKIKHTLLAYILGCNLNATG